MILIIIFVLIVLLIIFLYNRKNFCRRISLRLAGYKRPPFLLWQQQRRLEVSNYNFFLCADQADQSRLIPLFKLTGKSFKKLKKKGVAGDIINKLKRLQDIEYKNEDNFLEDLREIIEDEKNTPYISAILKYASEKHHYSIYLYPDRLRWHFWGIGLIFVSLFLVNGEWILIFAGLIWMVLVIPFIVFKIFGKPVLNHIWSKWAPSLNRWLEGVIQYGYDSPNVDIGFLKACFPPAIFEPNDSVYWSPAGSEQESFLKAAILDMYPHPIGKEDNFFHETAFKRFAFYWCSPIWGSLLFLSVLLAFSLILLNRTPPCVILIKNPDSLILPIIVWLIYSIFFLWNESREFHRWTVFCNNDYNFLPPAIQPVIRNSFLADFFTSPKIQMITNFLATGIAAIYLLIVSIVSSTFSIYNSGLNVDDPERFKSLLLFIYKIIWFIKNTLF